MVKVKKLKDDDIKIEYKKKLLKKYGKKGFIKKFGTIHAMPDPNYKSSYLVHLDDLEVKEITQQEMVRQAIHQNFNIVIDDKLTFLSITHWHYKLLLKEKRGQDMIALYLFYHFLVQIRKSISVRANIKYIMKGMNFSRERIQKAKQGLMRHNLIRDAKIIDKKTNQIKGWATFLGFAPNKKNRENIIKTNTEIIKLLNYTIPPAGKPATGKNDKKATRRKSQPLETRPLNILRILKNNKNILRILKNKGAKAFSFEKDSKGYLYLWDTKLKYYLNTYKIKKNLSKLSKADPKHPNNKYYLYIATKLKDINDSFYDHKNFPNPIKWTDDIRKLAQYDIGCNGTPTKAIKKRLKVVLNHYENAIGQEYSHVLQSGKSFREKFFKVEDAIKRESNFNGKEIGDHFKYMHGTLLVDKGEK